MKKGHYAHNNQYKHIRVPKPLVQTVDAFIAKYATGESFSTLCVKALESFLNKEPSTLPDAEDPAILTAENPRYAQRLKLAQQHAIAMGGKCLSESYGDTPGRNKTLTWQCRHGHIWTTRYALVMGVKKTWCPDCARNPTIDSLCKATVTPP